MAGVRRPRAFWERLVAEVERSGSLSTTARRRGVNPRTLAWWKWTLGREASPAPPPESSFLPVVFSAGEAAVTTSPVIEVEVAGVAMLRVPAGTDVAYVAALIAAVRATC